MTTRPLSISDNKGNTWYSRPTYWRYEDRHTTSGTRVYLRQFPVLSRTPKGVWLDLGFGMKRFVRDDARRRFACPTRDEARQSFLARKRRQLKILTAQVRQVEAALQADAIEEADADAFVTLFRE